MNCKQEFLEEVKDKKVLCAIIQKNLSYNGNADKCAKLRIGYFPEEFEEFLSEINYEYDDGFGGQNIYGTIWYRDGTWSERGEYDGSEWWEYKCCPVIPEILK